MKIFSQAARALAIAGYVFLMTSLPARAAEQCNRFDPVPSPLSSQWIQCPGTFVTLQTSNVSSIGGASDNYLKATDKSGPSRICSAPTNPLLGDWSRLGDCTEFCFDAQAFDNFDSTLRTISIGIGSGPKSFVFAFGLAADKLLPDGLWHKFCVPINPVDLGNPLPSNAKGSWVPRPGTLASDWNTVLSNVTEITLPIDLTKSPSEVMGYDNLCLSPGNCGETIIKSFTKSAKRDCDMVIYTLHVDVVSNGASPQTIFISDSWPAGLLPASAVQVSGAPPVTTNTILTATGWAVDFTTATGAGSINGGYDITFTSQIDPAFLSSGDFKLVNQATLKIGKDGKPLLSDDPATAAPGDETIVEVLAADIKACKDPPPGKQSCLSADAKVTCGNKPGTYVITLNTVGAGGVVPDFVQITPLTPGISLSPAQVSYAVTGGQVQVTVVGATPGQTIEFDVEGTTLDAGSVKGTDLCCNGKIQVTIPKDLACGEPKVDITKNCGPATAVPNSHKVQANCAITVTSTGAVTTPLSISETLSGAGTVSFASSFDPWTCVPPSVPGGTPMACTLPANTLNPVSDTSVINVTVDFANMGDAVDAKNCARLSPGGAESCDGFAGGEIKVEKICEPATEVVGAINHFEASCKITVTSTGPISGLVAIAEMLGGAGTITGISHSDPWVCSPSPAVPVNTPINCTIPGSAFNPAGDTSVVDVTLSFANAGDAVDSSNCATLSLDGQPGGESCVPITITQAPNLTIEKTGPQNCLPGQPCDFTVTITSVGQPFSGNVLLWDVVTPNIWQVLAITPNICGAPVTTTPFGCVASLTLAANQAMSFQVTLAAPLSGALENENCVGVAMAPAGLAPNTIYTLAEIEAAVQNQMQEPLGQSCWRVATPVVAQPSLTVTKTCAPAIQGANGFEALCQITVTATGAPLPQTIQVDDLLMGPSNVPGFHNEIVAMTSPENWACPAMPVNVGIMSPCYLPGADLAAAGGQSVITVKAHFPDAGNARESQNCVEAAGLDSTGAPLISAPRVCVPFTAATPVAMPKCDPQTAALVGKACRCTIKGMVPVSATSCACSGNKELRGGECVTRKPDCKVGTSFNPQRNRCEQLCREGTTYDAKRNACVLLRPVCKAGTRFNPQRNRCEQLCREGTRYDAKRNACIITVKPKRECPEGTRFNIRRNACIGIKPDPVDQSKDPVDKPEGPVDKPKTCKDPRTGAEIPCR